MEREHIISQAIERILSEDLLPGLSDFARAHAERLISDTSESLPRPLDAQEAKRIILSAIPRALTALTAAEIAVGTLEGVPQEKIASDLGFDSIEEMNMLLSVAQGPSPSPAIPAVWQPRPHLRLVVDND